MATAAAAQPTERPGRVKSFLKLVAIEHSVFALPFAYLSALAAMQVNGGRVRWLDLLLITVAMVGARTSRWPRTGSWIAGSTRGIHVPRTGNW